MTRTPLLKWPGGKRWAASSLTPVLQPALERGGCYYEPFLGGGAIFFHLAPHKAVLGDINPELVAAYETVRDYPDEVRAALQSMQVSAEDYYRIRASKPENQVLSAARLLYLNRTAFGGMYRLNRKGEFNVPFGGGERNTQPLTQTELLRDVARALAGARLVTSDFETLMNEAGQGDVIYCDPAYTVMHNDNCFVRYNERNFCWADQQRLAAAARRAVLRGATVAVTNACHPSLADLYVGFESIVLTRHSRISRRVSARRVIQEYLFIKRPESDVP